LIDRSYGATPTSPGVSSDQSLMGNFWTRDASGNVVSDSRTGVRDRHLGQISGDIASHQRAAAPPPDLGATPDVDASIAPPAPPSPDSTPNTTSASDSDLPPGYDAQARSTRELQVSLYTRHSPTIWAHQHTNSTGLT
jgi:hypothetical protein